MSTTSGAPGTSARRDTDVLIVGAGAAGLVFALSLKQVGIECRIYEAVSDLKPVGVGINLLPHAVRELDELGLMPALDEVAIRTRAASYYNRFGQHVHTEPLGEAAGYPWPQYSLHRGDMQMVFLKAVLDRLGPDSVVTGHRASHVDIDEDAVTTHFVDHDGQPLTSVRSSVVIGADGIKSALRHQFYPDEGDPVYSGYTLWRGMSPFPEILGGANTTRIGWIDVGKLMVYPVRENVNKSGDSLTNFVATLPRPRPERYDWNSLAQLEDFYEPFSTWRFDWFDAPALLRQTDPIMEFPMVDRDPLPTWTFGRATLMGDAAHPMYPRGSNGAGQAILDARYLTGCFKRLGVGPEALAEYDRVRVEATAKVVRMNRADPPDVVLREVHVRSGDKPFANLHDIISDEEMKAINARYLEVVGCDIDELKNRPSFV